MLRSKKKELFLTLCLFYKLKNIFSILKFHFKINYKIYNVYTIFFTIRNSKDKTNCLETDLRRRTLVLVVSKMVDHPV